MRAVVMSVARLSAATLGIVASTYQCARGNLPGTGDAENFFSFFAGFTLAALAFVSLGNGRARVAP